MELAPSCSVATCLALCLSLCLSACNAQEPSPTSKSMPSSPSSVSAPVGTPQFSEPAVRGKIVDAVTQQPIQGVMVYGFYATTGGGTLAGGSKFGQHVKSFETETDASGVFTLPAWDTGTRVISGTMGNKFPMIGFYKPGYDLWADGLSSVAQYRPKSGIAGTEVEIKDGVRDWTKFPHRLPPITNEADRYAALDNSARMLMFEGECGWEAYARLLLVQHVETINAKRRFIPVDRRKGDDMPMDAYPLGIEYRKTHTQQFVTEVEKLLIRPAPLHRLRETFKATGSTWKCGNPEDLLRLAEAQLIGKSARH